MPAPVGRHLRTAAKSHSSGGSDLRDGGCRRSSVALLLVPSPGVRSDEQLPRLVAVLNGTGANRSTPLTEAKRVDDLRTEVALGSYYGTGSGYRDWDGS